MAVLQLLSVFEHHPCIVIYTLEGHKRKAEVKKLEALSVHQLINNQRNICSGLKTVGRRTAFCDKSTLWGGYWWFCSYFFFSPTPQGLCKNAVLINDLSKAEENRESC